jgi:gliding motility-associated-like protein
MPIKHLVKSLFLALIFIGSGNAFAQAPNISYQTPQIYPINISITPLAPTNTGGAVPATIYGQVSTFAGSGAIGKVNGQGTAASFSSPTRSAFDKSGNLYVSDRDNSQIRMITPTGLVSTFAGGGFQGSGNGQGTAASFNNPNGVTVDQAGNLYIADATNNLIRKITPTGLVSTFAGNTFQGSGNGQGTAASFYNPYGDEADSAGNIYVADTRNNLIRKITSTGSVSTFAGSGLAGVNNGTSATASFNNPNCIKFDAAGNMYVSDPNNYSIRKIDLLGMVTTFAGTGVSGSSNGIRTSATFAATGGLAIDNGTGYMYVADLGNNLIRKIDPSGMVTTLAGSLSPGSNNGIGTAASFNHPNDIEVLPGYLYVTDYGNSLIRKIILTGYTIDKTLPAGLMFDPTTGIISGTPTALLPATIYTITAYNLAGSSTTTVSIAVVATLLPSKITLPPNNGNIPVDTNDNYNPGGTSTNHDTPIIYTSSDTTIATITAGGLVHVVGAGTTVITATQAGDSIYSPAIPVSYTLNVYEQEIIDFPILPIKIIGDPDFPTGATSDVSLFPIKYTSSNQSVATVVNGVIHIVGIGTTNITASQDSTTYYLDAVPVTRQLTVDPSVIFGPIPDKNICDVDFDPGAVSNQYPIVYTSSNTAVATIIAGKIHIVGIGTTNITATDGFTTVIQPFTVDVIPQPTIIISASAQSPISICVGTAITFTATTTNAGDNPLYQWQVNGINVGTNSDTYTSNSFQNNDVVICTVSNTSTNCQVMPSTVSIADTIQVSPIVTPTIVINPVNAVCAGTSITFTTTVTNAGNNPSYQWQVNGTNAGTNSNTYSSILNNSDIVSCTLTSSINCSAPVTNSITVTVDSLPVVSLPNKITINHGSSIQLNPVVTGNISTYTWNPGIGLSDSTVSNPIVTPLIISTTYKLHVVSVSGCDGYGSITVNVFYPIVAPNTFTPNGDGINDVWNIPALVAYPNCTVGIYNRNGIPVYNSIGYPKAWDGTYNGKPLPVGTYYYVIDPKDGNRATSGSVTIIR